MTRLEFITAYNAKAREIMPHMAADLVVTEDEAKAFPASTSGSAIVDDVVFRRSEYLGGMAAVISALVK